MATEDNTSEATQDKTPEITDQETLEKALADEPVKAEAKTEPEPAKLERKDGDKIFGKYNSLEDAQNAFVSIQARATKAEQAIAELKKEMDGKTKAEIKGLEYDKQLDYLLAKVDELETFKAGLAEQLEAQGTEAAKHEDVQAIEAFIGKHPLLAETGLDEEFKLIATHPEMQEFTLESIYNARIKPKLEKLMGTKITTKERKLVGKSAMPEPDKYKDVSKMTSKEYEKYRAGILAEAGIK